MDREVKAILFDADGVLTVPEELFSVVYARSHGLDIARFDRFFQETFPAALVGQADLKELIAQSHDIWQTSDPDAVVDQWLRSEDVRNEEALEIIQQLRHGGIKCYLATNQEKYRGNYMQDKMFAGQFDGYFISNELGVKKPEREFFEKAIAGMRADIPDLKPEEVVFLDDTPSHIDGAQQLGIDARLYTDLEQIRSLNAMIGK
jgi:putative hydrolase of the HAD superfamily